MPRPYDNAQTVADEAALLTDFTQRSRNTFNQYPHQKNTAYGTNYRQCYDFFTCDNPKGTVVFIHGGYWQWCTKEDFAFVAPYCLAKQWQCILLEYPLTPAASMQEIVASISLSLDHLNQRQDLGERIIGMGHSAGAHLLAMLQNHSLFNELHLLSGLYDLSPIKSTHLNESINLTKKDIIELSPISHIPANHLPTVIAYGQDELTELKEQSENYAQFLKQNSNNFTTLAMPKTNHYTILDHYFAQFFSTINP